METEKKNAKKEEEIEVWSKIKESELGADS